MQIIEKLDLFLECFRIRKVGRGRYSDDEQPLEFDLSKSGSLLAFADRNLSSCTGIETAVKMPEESDFTPKPGLLTAVYKRFNVIRLQVLYNYGYIFPHSLELKDYCHIILLNTKNNVKISCLLQCQQESSKTVTDMSRIALLYDRDCKTKWLPPVVR